MTLHASASFRAEEELRISEQRYRSLVEATAAIVWSTPASGEFETPQPEWSAFTGQNFEDLKGWGWLNAIHPEDQPHTAKMWADALERRSVYNVEHRLRRRDGAYRHMSVRGVPIFDDRGEVREWIGVHTDVTDRRRAEQANRFLAEASAILSSSLDYSATLTSIAKLAVPEFGDWCAFDLAVSAGPIKRIVVHHEDPEKVEQARQIEARYPPHPDDLHGVPLVLRTGRPELWPQVHLALVDALAKDAEHASYIRSLGLSSGLIVPLIARGRVLGAMSLYYAQSGRRYDAADLALAEDLGRRAGLAVDNALLYRESRDAVRSREEVTALLDTLLEKAPVGFALFNNDLRYLRVNEELTKIDGVPAHEHWGRKISELLPGMPACVEEALAHVRDTGETVVRQEISGTTRADAGAAHDFLMRYYPVRTPTQSLGIGVVVVDITDRKAVERELLEQTSRTQKLFQEVQEIQRRLAQQLEFTRGITDNVAEGLYAVDANGRATFINPAAEKILGHSSHEFLSRDVHDLVHFQHADRSPHPREQCPLLEVIQSNRTIRVADDVFTRKDGSILPVAYASSPIIEEGKVIGAVVAFHDITQQKWVEQMLRRSNEELERLVDVRTAELRSANNRLEMSNRQLEDFASVASHDLQEPLRKIQAFGDRLSARSASSLGEEGRDYLQRMQSAAGRMQTLISDLLSFARVTTRAQPFAQVDLGQVAMEVLSDLEATLERFGGAVQLLALPTIDADPTQMRQLLQNLIANALKFRRQDVPPRVRVSSNLTDDGRTCQILVEDNGIGFDEKYLDRIFNVFQRLHGRGQYEGTGIGLAVCRKIAERHGGSITARSRAGEGSTFIVTLPLRQDQTEETRA